MSRPFADESVFRAIADPTRRRVLELLRVSERPVTEIAQTLGISMRNLSPHLKVLRLSGLLVQHRRGRFRFYGLAAKDLKIAIAWLRPFERMSQSTRH